MTTLTLDAKQRVLLTRWLTSGADGARGLLVELFFDRVDAAQLPPMLADVRATRERFAGTPSTLVMPYAVQSPPLSDWQWAWLTIDRAPDDGAALTALCERFAKYREVLDAFGIFILASDSLERARARAAASAKMSLWVDGSGDDRSPWVRFFAGEQTALPKVGATSRDEAVVAALQGDWPEVDRCLPARVRRDYPRALRIGPNDLMIDQMLRQLSTHHQRGKPKASTLRTSLAALFMHWGRETKDGRWSGCQVSARLPLTALVAAVTKEDPLALLYEQRRWIDPLLNPPPRTFTPPKEVDEALRAYEELLAAAVASGRSFKRVGGPTSTMTLVPREEG